MKKSKKIILFGGLILAGTVGTVFAILIPVLTKTHNSKEQKIEKESLRTLAVSVVNANTKINAQKQAQLFYGLSYEPDLENVENENVKDKYTSANNLANYIFENKKTYDIQVVNGKEKITDIQEILFIFKNKMIVKDKIATTKKRKIILKKVDSLWHHKEIDIKNDHFALLHTFSNKNKLIKTDFAPAKIKNIPSTLNVHAHKDKIYDTIQLFFAFKFASPKGADFSNYNIGQDENVIAIVAIKDYLLLLKSSDSSINKDDLDREENLEISFIKGTPPAGKIIFKFEDYEEIKNITDFINISKITALPPTKKNEINHGETPKESDFNSPTQKNISFAFKEASAIDDLGKSNVTYTITDETGVSTKKITITFVVSGFQTKVEWANANIIDVSSKTVSAPTKKNKINYKATPIADDITPPTQAGFSFTFKEASDVNDNGESDVTYIVNVNPVVGGTTTKDLTFTISGFQSKVEAHLIDVNKNIQAVTLKTISTLPTKKNDVNYKATPQANDFNSPTQAGFSFTFKEASDVNDQGKSDVTYIVNVNPVVGGTTTKELTFTISGFQTKVKWANANIIDVSSKTVLAPTKKNDVNYKATPQANDFNSPTQAGFSFTFKEASDVNDQGKSDVTYIVDVNPVVGGTTTKELTFTISGFQTKVEFNVIDIANKNIQAVTLETISTLPTKKNDVNYKATPQANDFNSPTQAGFSFTFKEASDVNDQGKSDVTYIVDVNPVVGGTTTKELTFTISGFQTKVEFNVIDIANKNIQAVTLETISTLPTKKNDVNYKATPQANDFNSPTQAGFSFTFKEASDVNDQGKSDVTYIVDVNPVVGGTTTKELTFTISGFQTKVEFNVIDIANKNIQAVTLETISTLPTKKNDVNYKATPQANDFNSPTQAGFSFTFKEASDVNDQGKSDVTYIVDVNPVVGGTTTKELTFTISGFQTKVEFNVIDIANKNIQAVTLETISTLPTKKNDVNYKATPQANDFNSPTQAGFSFTFKEASDVNDQGKSDVTYIVDVNPVVGGTTTKELTFTISGFQTKVEFNVIDIANKNIQAVTLETISTLPTKKNDVNYKATPQANDFNSPTQAGFSFTFKEASDVNDQGKSDVTYIVDVNPVVGGTTTKELTFTINGFQTKVEFNVIDIANKNIQAVTLETISTLPTKKNDVNYKATPQANDFNSPTQASFSFTFKEASDVNDQGKSDVTYIVDVNPVVGGTTTKELTFTISGFQTKVEFNVIDIANKNIQAVTLKTISTLPTKKNDVNYKATPQANDFNSPTQAGFSFTFKEASDVNDQGKSDVTYIVDVNPVVGGTTTKELTFTISGFQTKVEFNVIDIANKNIQAVTLKTISTLPTKKNDVNYKATPQANDFNSPTQAGFSFTFKEASDVNDQGKSDVTYIVDVNPVVGGTTTKELTFTISGFQTKVEFNVINIANKNIQAVTLETISTLPTKKNDVNYKATPQANDFNSPTQAGFSFTFKEASDVNDQGKSDVTYIVDVNPVVGGTTTKELTFTINGFQTKVEFNIIDIANKNIQAVTLETISTLPTKKNDVNYKATPQANDFNSPTQAGFSFTFKEASDVNDQGKSDVTYIVDVNPVVGGTTTKELTFTISGFETKALANARLAQAKIDNAKNGATHPTKKNHVNFGNIPLEKDVNAPSKKGITFTFKVATIVNNNGESTFTYVVDVNPKVAGTITKEVSFDVSGFETKALANARLAQAKIDNAKNGATHPTKKNHVNFGNIPLEKDVNAPSKKGITFTFKVATIVNNNGESTFTYVVDVNPKVAGTITKEVSFDVSGFETKALANARLAQNAIQKLVAANFTTNINKDKIAELGQPNKDNIVIDIKKTISNPHIKALILPSDIIISFDNITRTITIVINNHGPSKTITISGFLSLIDYLDQVLINIPSSGGALTIPEGITSSQFDTYIEAMGNVLNAEGTIVKSKFAEKYSTKITSIQFPNSFTTIDDWFKDFNKITSLTLGENLQTIDANAFFNAKLTSLSIPNTVTSIGKNAFAYSPLTLLTLGNQLQTISEGAFYNAKLTSLSIPNTVTSIGKNAFAYSPLTLLTLGNQLQTISEGAFYNAKLTSLIIPNTVTSIGMSAFNSSSLTSLLRLGAKLQTIGQDAFFNAKLTSLTIPNTVTLIGKNAFASSPLTLLRLGVKLQTIGEGAFYNAKLTSLTIPNTVTSIGMSAFNSSSLTSLLRLGAKLQTIGQGAFFNAKLTSLTIPNTVTSIGKNAFASSPLTLLTLGNQLQTISEGAFYNAKLTSLSIPNTVTSIGKNAFASSLIPTINIFKDVLIGDNAFKSTTIIQLIPRPIKPIS